MRKVGFIISPAYQPTGFAVTTPFEIPIARHGGEGKPVTRQGMPRSVIPTIYSSTLFGNSADRWSMKTRTEGRRPRR
jgi:hypothetical protein